MSRSMGTLRSVFSVSSLCLVVLAAQPADAGKITGRGGSVGPAPATRSYAGTIRPQASAREPRLTLELFSGPPLVFERVAEIRGDGATTWVGALGEDPHARLYLTHRGGIAFGEAHAHGRVYEILGVGESWEVAEIEPGTGVCATGIPDDGLPPAPAEAKQRSIAPLKPAETLLEPAGTRVLRNTKGAHASTAIRAATDAKGSGALRPIGRRFKAELVDRNFYHARVDVLGLYTEGARTSAWQSLSPDDKAHLESYLGQVDGGRLAMEARIENQVAKANDAFAQSGVIVRLALAHMAEVEKPSIATNILSLRDWIGVQINQPNSDLASLRDTHEADLVSLFDRHTGSDGVYCGIAYTLGPWPVSVAVVNVVDYDCMPGMTFAHEVGHNFGAAHDRYYVEEQYAAENEFAGTDYDPDDAGLFDYSYGYIHSPVHRTIMAYDAGCETCPQIPRFSNPDLPHDGTPTGIPSEADNARTINHSWYYVSRQRPDEGLPPPPTP